MDIPRDWTFKTSDVATGFDQHVREQLPWYDLMSGAVAHIARHYIPEGGTIYDLGCSTGNIGTLLADIIATRRATLIPIDNAESMRNEYRGPGEFTVADVGTMDFQMFDVAVAFLCLMFIPKAKRAGLIARLRAKCNPGGVIIVVDKIENAGGYIGTVMNRLTLAGKVASKVPSEQIIAKEMSLAGVQRPLTINELTDATQVFQFGEFAGFVMES